MQQENLRKQIQSLKAKGDQEESEDEEEASESEDEPKKIKKKKKISKKKKKRAVEEEESESYEDEDDSQGGHQDRLPMQNIDPGEHLPTQKEVEDALFEDPPRKSQKRRKSSQNKQKGKPFAQDKSRFMESDFMNFEDVDQDSYSSDDQEYQTRGNHGQDAQFVESNLLDDSPRKLGQSHPKALKINQNGSKMINRKPGRPHRRDKNVAKIPGAKKSSMSNRGGKAAGWDFSGVSGQKKKKNGNNNDFGWGDEGGNDDDEEWGF